MRSPVSPGLRYLPIHALGVLRCRLDPLLAGGARRIWPVFPGHFPAESGMGRAPGGRLGPSTPEAVPERDGGDHRSGVRPGAYDASSRAQSRRVAHTTRLMSRLKPVSWGQVRISPEE